MHQCLAIEILQKNDTKLIAVAYSYLQLWPFEVKFSPKNVNFTQSIVHPTSQLWIPVIKNKKNINLNQWFQYQNCTSLIILEENNLFQMCLGVPALI